MLPYEQCVEAKEATEEYTAETDKADTTVDENVSVSAETSTNVESDQIAMVCLN